MYKFQVLELDLPVYALTLQMYNDCDSTVHGVRLGF